MNKFSVAMAFDVKDGQFRLRVKYAGMTIFLR